MEDIFNVDFPEVEIRRGFSYQHGTDDMQSKFKKKFRAGGPGYGQKCFLITVDGLKTSTDRYIATTRRYYVFPTFIITCIKLDAGVSYRCASVREHRLSNLGLRCLKLANFHHCYEDPFTSVEKFEKDLERYRTVFEELNVHDRQTFEEEKVAHELKVVRQAFELEEGRQALERDREAFERERRDLERELAKYKGIVGDCLKEISTYL